MDPTNDVTRDPSGGNNSRAISEAFKTPETVNLTEKNGISHQRHNRQYHDGKVTSLSSLLGLPVELSNGIAVQMIHKITIKLTYTSYLLVSKLAVWVLCIGNRA